MPIHSWNIVKDIPDTRNKTEEKSLEMEIFFSSQMFASYFAALAVLCHVSMT